MTTAPRSASLACGLAGAGLAQDEQLRAQHSVHVRDREAAGQRLVAAALPAEHRAQRVADGMGPRRQAQLDPGEVLQGAVQLRLDPGPAHLVEEVAARAQRTLVLAGRRVLTAAPRTVTRDGEPALPDADPDGHDPGDRAHDRGDQQHLRSHLLCKR